MAKREQKVQKNFVIEIRVVADGDGIRMIPGVYQVRETAKMYAAIDQTRRFLKGAEGLADIPDESFNLKHPKVKLRVWKAFQMNQSEVPRRIKELKRMAMAKLMNHHQQIHHNLGRITRGLTLGFADNFTD